jgi:REP element-mobilizing transposase RayT
MTAPRQILPEQLYLVTRRCTQRQFLLRPDEGTKQIFLYALGDAAARFGIELIAWHASSNHYHAVVYDPRGELPLFLERFHKLCARALNARWKRWENLWAAEATCAVRLIEDEDVLEKVVYTLANPVVDHLVSCSSLCCTFSSARNCERAVIAGNSTRATAPSSTAA